MYNFGPINQITNNKLNKNKVNKDDYNTFVDGTNKEILKKVNQSDYSSKISEYDNKFKDLNETDSILSSRIDTFTSLPEGIYRRQCRTC